MALSEMKRLGAQAHEKFDIAHIGIVHRTGRLEIGETSVVISVSAPHRRAAFEACEWAIRELKRTVPIWKKEVFEDGEVWVEGESVSTTRVQLPHADLALNETFAIDYKPLRSETFTESHRLDQLKPAGRL